MRAGSLRHRLTLQEKSVTRDSYGGETITWVDVRTIWAELNPWTMREELVERRKQGESIIGAKIRSVDIDLSMRLLFDGTGYQIVNIDPTNKHRGELLITAKAEDTAP